MKRIFLIMLCLVLLSGCMEKKSDVAGSAGSAEGSLGKVIVTISSPRDGQILQGNDDVLFQATAKGGKAPYSYRWSSNINGELSTRDSFRKNPSDLGKGRHMIIAVAKDANGISGQGSVQINVV